VERFGTDLIAVCYSFWRFWSVHCFTSRQKQASKQRVAKSEAIDHTRNWVKSYGWILWIMAWPASAHHARLHTYGHLFGVLEYLESDKEAMDGV
jgi:hypothetical protein